MRWRGFYVRHPDRVLGVQFVPAPPSSVPRALITQAQRESTLDSFLDGWLSGPEAQRLGAKATSRTSTRLLDRYPGRQLALTFNNRLVGEARAFLVDDMICLLEFEHPATAKKLPAP